MSDSSDLIDYARQLASAQGLDPDFVESVGNAESGWKPNLVSKAGAIGPMQLMPGTAKQLGVDPSDPYDNVRGGVTYLKQLSDQFNGDPALTAAAYNAGPGAVQKAGGVPNFPETQKYVDKVTTANIDPSTIDWGTTPSAAPADATALPADAVPDASQIDWGTPPDGSHVGPIDAMAAGLKHATRAVFGDNAVAAINNLGAKLGMGDSSKLEANVTAAKNAPTTAADTMLPQTIDTTPSTGLFNIPSIPIPVGWLPNSVKAALVGGGKATTSIAQGVQQGVNLLTGADKAPLAAQVASENAGYQPLKDAYPISTALGEAAPSMAIPYGSANILGMIGKSALGNAIPGLLSYGSGTDRLTSGAEGAVGGALGASLGGLFGRTLNPFRAADPLEAAATAARANHFGVNLDPAQATQSQALKTLTTTLRQLPGSSGVMAKADEANNAAINRGVFKEMGAENVLNPDGTLHANTVTDHDTGLLQQNFNAPYAAAHKGVNVDMGSDPVLNSLGNAEAKYDKMTPPSDQRAIVTNYVNDLLGNPTMDGDTYQAWRGQVGKRARTAVNANNPELANALNGIKRSMDQAFAANATPAQNALLQQTNAQYANYKNLKPLIEKAQQSTSGNISPPALAGYTLGNPGPLGQLAQLGQVVREYTGSDTAPKMMWQNLLEHPATTGAVLGGSLGGLSGAPNGVQGGISGASEGSLAGAALGRATPWMVAKMLQSKYGNQWLSRGLLNVSPTTERLLMRGGGLLGLSGTNLLTSQ